MTYYWSDIQALIIKAKSELLASPLRSEYQGYKDDNDDQNFLFEVDPCGDAELKASPSLEDALVKWAHYRAADVLQDSNTILNNLNGRNRIEIADIEDFARICWRYWKEPKPLTASAQPGKTSPT